VTMGRTVWCVFQKLPGESCPGLAAVCGSREVADELVEVSERDEREQGRPASTWTVSAWSVLDGDVGKIDDIQHISDVMDPMRMGAIPEEEEEPGNAEEARGG